MDLRGSLLVFEPISVLQFLNLSSVTGELKFEVKGNSARVYFDAGTVTYAEISTRRFRLGEFLVAKELISREALDIVLSTRNKGEMIGAALLRLGAIDEQVLRTTIEEHMREVIYEVVRWRKGSFGFVSGRKPSARDVVIGMPLENLMLEGLKRMDEEGQGT